MFYSHELLTSRQYGVATIWLVATLGSKSNLKKVTRKAILDVDVPKACNTITDPSTPLALRLQASLLYGVSRVYAQQCTYVLADAQSFREKMRGITTVMRELDIDLEVGRTRPEQLNLPDDPAFMLDLDMNFDLSAFDIPELGSNSRSPSVLSARTLPSSQTSQGADEEEPVLELPSMDASDIHGGFDYNFGIATSSALKSGSKISKVMSAEEPGIIQHPEFEMTEDGDLIQIPRAAPPSRDSEALQTGAGGGGADDSVISARVRAEHAAGDLDFDQVEHDEPMVLGDDDHQVPQGDPFSPRPTPVDQETVGDTLPQDAQDHQLSEEVREATAEASERPARHIRSLPVDQRTEHGNRQLNEWNRDYLDNMAHIAKIKEQQRSLAQAKKNAAFWMLQQGIGGVEVNLRSDQEPHALSVFSGQALLDALLGPDSSSAGSKRSRSRSSGEDEDERARRVRARTDNEALVDRGDPDEANVLGDEDGIIPQDDDNLMSEVGRQAPSSLPDQLSSMPWNRSSRQGSAFPFSSAAPAVSSSIGGNQYDPRSRLSRHGSRLTSASPLHGRGLPRLPSEDSLQLSSDGLRMGSEDVQTAEGVDIDQYELYGPAAEVNTQTAAQSQWLTTTLENEAHNFLTFLETQMGERGDEQQEEGQQPVKTIVFDNLLPPESNSALVGAQAMLHVLALATKGLIRVAQNETFGHIHMQVVSPTRVGSVEEELEL